jgi:hypothetical protein
MLEDGLWSKFTFKYSAQAGGGTNRKDHEDFADLLLITALMAKRLCNPQDEYEVFEEFVFHNLEEAE